MKELQQLKRNEKLEKIKDTSLIPSQVKTKHLEDQKKKQGLAGNSSIAVTKKGILVCACYSGGDGGMCRELCRLVERSVDGGETWSEPIARW